MIIEKSVLGGKVTLPPSKSELHRALICAALCDKKSTINGFGACEDVTATAAALKEMGADIITEGATAWVCAGNIKNQDAAAVVDCKNSASTLRFLMPVAAALNKKTTFILGESLTSRPITPYLKIFEEHGAKIETTKNKITVSGRLCKGVYTVDGSLSSQFLSGFLMALPLLDAPCKIVCSGESVSAKYVDMTTEIMRRFGVNITKKSRAYKVFPAEYKESVFTSCGDWSAAAFYYAAVALGAKITLKGLEKNTLQPDRAATEIFNDLGVCTLFLPNGDISLSPAAKDHNIKIDLTHNPDLFPAVCVAATGLKTTEITGVSRLSNKESNRLTAMQKGLSAFGIKAKISGNKFTVYGGAPNAHNRTVQGEGDHRIVMAFAVLSAFCEGKTEITTAKSVQKSYPEFFNHLGSLGGKCFE